MTELSVVMTETDGASRDQESLITEANVNSETDKECMKYERQKDKAKFGYLREELKVRKQTDGKRYPSKKEASIGRRQNRSATIGGKEADAAGFAEMVCAIRNSENIHAN